MKAAQIPIDSRVCVPPTDLIQSYLKKCLLPNYPLYFCFEERGLLFVLWLFFFEMRFLCVAVLTLHPNRPSWP